MPNNALKLKDSLQTNVGMALTIQKRVGSYPETDYNTKEPTGRQIYLYIFRGPDGTEYKHYCNELEQSTLEAYQPGDTVQVVRTEKMKPDGKRISFLQWGSPGSAEMTAQPQLNSNTALQRQEKQQEAYQEKEDVKSIQIGLQGFQQQIIPVLMREALGKGLDLKDEDVQIVIINASLDWAEQAHAAVCQRASSLAHRL